MSAPRRAPRRKLDGVFLLDKPLGLSSNQALQIVRRLFNAEKAGHTGTLDPLATGLLPVCFGEATKFSGELLGAEKRYLATVQLGVITDTLDTEGVVLERRVVNASLNDVEQVLKGFLGSIEQIPPMFSALKRDGKPLYEYARAGIELERDARIVHIHQLELCDWQSDSFTLDVRCSKGTYIRTLAADIGERLGCGAHISALRRTEIGQLSISKATPLATLDGTAILADRDRFLESPDSLLLALEEVNLDQLATTRLLQGQTIPSLGEVGARVRVYDHSRRFLGVCTRIEDGGLRPQRLVATHSA